MTRPAAISTTQIDNGAVRVIRWDFVPGAETAWHIHEYDYVVVPLNSGSLMIETPDGSVTVANLSAGASYSRRVGPEHNVINGNDHDFAFVEIEFWPESSSV